MKKTAITLLLAGITASAGAQTMYDALNYSKSDYAGTARTVAMGNAFTALGGDLGAVTINPAGSAVARYSQVTVTPGVNISVNSATGAEASYGFEKNLRTSMARFTMPNFGFTINFDTHRTSGLKNWTLGFVANQTANWQDDLVAGGSNTRTSLAGSLASFANGYDVSALSADNAYDMIPVSDWRAIAALQSRVIGLTPDTNISDEYLGVTENWSLVDNGDGTQHYEFGLGGAIDQTFGRRTLGNRYDYVINLGGNISDVVFIGANLGITSMRYSHEYYIRETSQDPDLFQTQFNSLTYNYGYDASGVGVYGKFGIIAVPVNGLRIGAAIQTPTSTTITETWRLSAEQTSYAEDYQSGSADSPEGEYTYRLISPFRFNVGAAYTFGSVGLISIDYEMCNYNSMKFRETGTNDNSGFDSVNTDIRDYMGASHEVRAGVEIKPIPSLAIRAGYNFSTPAIPEDIEYENQYLWERTEGNTHSASFGLGYSSKGSFFADAAVRMTKYADTYIYPHDYYYLDGDQPMVDTSMPTPVILSRRTLWNVLLTIGFRF